MNCVHTSFFKSAQSLEFAQIVESVQPVQRGQCVQALQCIHCIECLHILVYPGLDGRRRCTTCTVCIVWIVYTVYTFGSGCTVYSVYRIYSLYRVQGPPKGQSMKCSWYNWRSVDIERRCSHCDAACATANDQCHRWWRELLTGHDWSSHVAAGTQDAEFLAKYCIWSLGIGKVCPVHPARPGVLWSIRTKWLD